MINIRDKIKAMLQCLIQINKATILFFFRRHARVKFVHIIFDIIRSKNNYMFESSFLNCVLKRTIAYRALLLRCEIFVHNSFEVYKYKKDT